MNYSVKWNPGAGTVDITCSVADWSAEGSATGPEVVRVRLMNAEAAELGTLLANGYGVRTLREEVEQLRMTTAEDKRHMDRQAAEIRRLTGALDDANGVAAYWKRTAVIEAAEADDADTLRATVVRQANEITALKGENAA